MTISRGQAWGAPGSLPAGAPIAQGDAELASLAATNTIVGLAGGDLFRTVGGHGLGVRPPDRSVHLPVDLGEAVLDGTPHPFAAHVVAGGPWWRGPLVMVMNAQYRGTWDVAPRSHPNDGLLDVLEVHDQMPLRQRWRARRRLPSGTHLPHPQLRMVRAPAWGRQFQAPVAVWVDGVKVPGRVANLEVRCRPDAVTVVV